MKRTSWMILPLLVILSASPPASAQASEMGVVDDVQNKQGAIVVDDTWYQLAPGFRVFGSDDGKLEKKMKIAFTTGTSDDGKKTITQIWVLPANFVLPEDD